MDNYLLQVNNLKTWFAVKKGLFGRTACYVKAVDGVSFKISRGQTFGLVGESGCGKTTVAKSIVRLVPVNEGRVVFKDVDVLSAEKGTLRKLRRDISLVFQDPYGSLNRRMTVGNIIGEPLKVHRLVTDGELAERIAELLSSVGLSPGDMNRYPHEFSGGQRQRIGIARALSVGAEFVICDEPVSSMDVSVQAHILNLLKDLQEEFGLTYLFIAHNLAVVRFFCDVVAVMCMGKIVEQASSRQLYRNPLHPYTQALISAIPSIDLSVATRKRAFMGELPRVLGRSEGCVFHRRCPWAEGRCAEQQPELRAQKDDDEHFVACWRPNKKLDGVC